MNKEDIIIQKLVELDARFDTVATNARVDDLERRIFDTLDAQTVILKRLDEDRYMTKTRLDRHDIRIEALKERPR